MNEETFEIQTNQENQSSDFSNQETNTQTEQVNASSEISTETLNYYINVCNIGMFILLAIGFVGGCLIGSRFIGGLWNK